MALVYLYVRLCLMFQACPILSIFLSEPSRANTFRVLISDGCEYSQFAHQHFARWITRHFYRI